jgi:hypothetical protein
LHSMQSTNIQANKAWFEILCPNIVSSGAVSGPYLCGEWIIIPSSKMINKRCRQWKRVWDKKARRGKYLNIFYWLKPITTDEVFCNTFSFWYSLQQKQQNKISLYLCKLHMWDCLMDCLPNTIYRGKIIKKI